MVCPGLGRASGSEASNVLHCPSRLLSDKAFNTVPCLRPARGARVESGGRCRCAAASPAPGLGLCVSEGREYEVSE